MLNPDQKQMIAALTRAGWRKIGDILMVVPAKRKPSKDDPFAMEIGPTIIRCMGFDGELWELDTAEYAPYAADGWFDQE